MARANRPREFLLPEEIVGLIASARTDAHALMFRLMYTHACAPGTIRQLRWRQVNLKAGFFRVNRKSFFLSAGEIASFRTLKRTSKFVFLSPRGFAISDTCCVKLFSEAGNKAGLSHLKPHPSMMRHSKAFVLSSEGHSSAEIANALRYKSTETALKYSEPYRLNRIRKKSSGTIRDDHQRQAETK